MPPCVRLHPGRDAIPSMDVLEALLSPLAVQRRGRLVVCVETGSAW